MKEKMVSILAAGLLLMPGIVLAKTQKCVTTEVKKFRNEQREERREFIEAQRKENREFRRTLKDMTPEERIEAIMPHWENQYQERREFNKKMYEKNIAQLKDRLENNEKLADAQKSEIISLFENQHTENVAFRDQQYKENIKKIVFLSCFLIT